MTKSQKEDILDYTSPPKIMYIVGAVTIALSPAVYFIVQSIKHDQLLSISGGITEILVGILFLVIRPWYNANVMKTLKKNEADYGSGKIYYDFRNGKRLANDTIICGERYLFCKGMGIAIYCPDIVQIKYETSEIRFISASDNITVRLKNREKLIIRSMPHEKSNREKFAKIINVIKKSCPDAEIRA